MALSGNPDALLDSQYHSRSKRRRIRMRRTAILKSRQQSSEILDLLVKTGPRCLPSTTSWNLDLQSFVPQWIIEDSVVSYTVPNYMCSVYHTASNDCAIPLRKQVREPLKPEALPSHSDIGIGMVDSFRKSDESSRLQESGPKQDQVWENEKRLRWWFQGQIICYCCGELECASVDKKLERSFCRDEAINCCERRRREILGLEDPDGPSDSEDSFVQQEGHRCINTLNDNFISLPTDSWRTIHERFSAAIEHERKCIATIRNLPAEAFSELQLPWVGKLVGEYMSFTEVAGLIHAGAILSREDLLEAVEKHLHPD